MGVNHQHHYQHESCGVVGPSTTKTMTIRNTIIAKGVTVTTINVTTVTNIIIMNTVAIMIATQLLLLRSSNSSTAIRKMASSLRCGKSVMVVLSSMEMATW